MNNQNPKLNESKKSDRSFLILIFIFIIVGALILFSLLVTPSSTPQKIVISGKDFYESSILLEMMALEFEKLGAEVERKHNFGLTSRLISSLENGEIQAYPDYSGTFLAEIVKSDSLAKNRENHTYKRLNFILETKLSEQKPYRILHPFRVNNSYEIVMMRDEAESLLGDDLTLTALSKVAFPEGFMGGFTRDVPKREDGLPGLERVYGLRFEDWITVEHERIYDLLKRETINITDGYSTDTQLFFEDDLFAIIKDDRNVFPAYHPIPMIRKEVLRSYPEIEENLRIIADVVNNETIARITKQLKDKEITMDDLERSPESQAVLQAIITDYLKENM